MSDTKKARAGRARAPVITGLYCSDLGHACTNAEMLAINRQRIFPDCRRETARLYEKLLSREPERRRKFALVPYEQVLNLDIHAKFELFRGAAVALLTDAANGVLRTTGLDPQQIDTLIICYMAGKTLPSLNALLAHELGLRPDIISLTLGDMGCSAGVAAVDLASRMLRGQRRAARALVMALEPVGALFQADDEQGSVVGNTLFGEGCAAVVVSTHPEPALYHIGPSQRVLHADEQALGAITLASRDTGPMINLSRDIPKVAGKAVEANLTRLVPRTLGAGARLRYLLTRRPPRWQRLFDHWAIHPGGTAVLDGMRDTLRLSEADLGPSYRVFHERSNMSSPSVFYALDNIERRAPRRGDRVLMMSFGSGFKVNALVLRRGKRPSAQPPERHAVVVGGTSGIGLAVTRMLCERGYHTFVGSRRVGQRPHAQVEGATYVPVDITDPQSVAAFSRRIWQESFGIDVLVISVGVAPPSRMVGRLDEETLAATIDTNLTGVMRLTNALVGRVRRRGQVVMLNSLLGRIPLMGNAAYCASKAGLRHFCETLQLELQRAGRRVRVHSLYPAYVETPMYEGVEREGRTLLRPIAAELVALEVGRNVDGRGRGDGLMLRRDRTIVQAERRFPRIFRRVMVGL